MANSDMGSGFGSWLIGTGSEWIGASVSGILCLSFRRITARIHEKFRFSCACMIAAFLPSLKNASMTPSPHPAIRRAFRPSSASAENGTNAVNSSKLAARQDCPRMAKVRLFVDRSSLCFKANSSSILRLVPSVLAGGGCSTLSYYPTLRIPLRPGSASFNSRIAADDAELRIALALLVSQPFYPAARLPGSPQIRSRSCRCGRIGGSIGFRPARSMSKAIGRKDAEGAARRMQLPWPLRVSAANTNQIIKKIYRWRVAVTALDATTSCLEAPSTTIPGILLWSVF
jgi:hypothetical protein